MKEKFFKFVRWMMISITSIAMLVVIGLGVEKFLEFGVTTDKEPKVEFSNFKEFKNTNLTNTTNKVDNSLLAKKQEMFQEVFYENSKNILANISKYSVLTNQKNANAQRLEEYLFKQVSNYNYDLRASYIKQLSLETENLLDYAEEAKEDSTKKAIEWTDFLNWFHYDFEDQLNSKTDMKKVEKVEASSADVFTVYMLVLVTLALFSIMLQLLRIESKISKNISEDEKEIEAPEPVKKKTPAKRKTKED